MRSLVKTDSLQDYPFHVFGNSVEQDMPQVFHQISIFSLVTFGVSRAPRDPTSGEVSIMYDICWNEKFRGFNHGVPHTLC